MSAEGTDALLALMREMNGKLDRLLTGGANAAPRGGNAAGGGDFGGGSGTFPNYGRSKGQPIAGATEQDLDYYAAGARRSLGDPAKSRFHDKEGLPWRTTSHSSVHLRSIAATPAASTD